MLRYTDNPIDGSLTPGYPAKDTLYPFGFGLTYQ